LRRQHWLIVRPARPDALILTANRGKAYDSSEVGFATFASTELPGARRRNEGGATARCGSVVSFGRPALNFRNTLAVQAMEQSAHPRVGGSTRIKLACALIRRRAKSMDCLSTNRRCYLCCS
jgi:hypothetical protein